MRRTVLTLLAVCAAVPLAAWFLLARQANTFGEGLVADARKLEARSFELPGAPGELFACAGL